MKKTLSIRIGGDGAGAPAPARAPSAERLERLKERARDLRRHPTEAETILWERLGGSRLGGIKFTRKAVVGSAIVDFACPSRWVVVSLSGPDANAEVDALQDRKLAETGIRVMRFSADEVLADADRVARLIAAKVNEPFQRPGAPAPRRRVAG